MVNLGTSLLLAALLVWFEKKFMRQVRGENEQIAQQAASKAAEEAAVRTAATLTPRLDELDKLVKATATAAREQQEATIDALGEQASRSNVLSALRAAAKIRAIGSFGRSIDSSVVVPAGDEKDSPMIGIAFSEESDPDDRDQRPSSIRLRYDGDESTSVEWPEEVDPAAVFFELQQSMIRNGFAPAANRLSTQRFFKNLRALLKAAMEARQDVKGHWLTGAPVHEMVFNGWIITEAGVEILGHGVPITPEQYPHGSGRFRTRYKVGAPPADVDSYLWGHAAERGVKYFTVPEISDVPF
jgi:hypothetical protein